MIQGAVDQKPVWDIPGAPETLSRGFSLGIPVWRVTLCLLRHHNPGHCSQHQLGGGSGMDLAQEELLICNSGKETGIFRRSVRILLITMICSKAWEEFCLFSSTNWPIPGSHPATAQIKDIIPPQGALGAAHRSTLQFSLWPTWIPSLLPHNHLLLQAEHHRKINPELLHFPAKIISQQTCYKPSTPHLVGHITVHQPGHILPASGSAPLHSSWTKSRICSWKKPSSTAQTVLPPKPSPQALQGCPEWGQERGSTLHELLAG